MAWFSSEVMRDSFKMVNISDNNVFNILYKYFGMGVLSARWVHAVHS